MFAVLHSDIKSLKSGLLQLTGQRNSQKGRGKIYVKYGIISKAIYSEGLSQLIGTATMD
jgi:hypothetical protein